MKITNIIICSLIYFGLNVVFLPQVLLSQSELKAKEKRGKWGFIIGEKQTVIDYQFEKVKYFRNGLCPVLKNGKWGYIDEKGTTIIPFQYDDAATFIGKSTTIKIGEKYGLINTAGVPLTKMEYDTIFGGVKYFMIKKEEFYGLIDSLGKEKLPTIYEDFNGIYKNTYCVKKAGNWGMIVNGIEDFESEPIFLSPDIMPKFPGCSNNQGDEKEWKVCADRQLLRFVYKQIKYPAEARKKGIEGTVVVSFVVKKDGYIDNLEVAREIGGGCGKECLRVANLMPKWLPGEHEGRVVNTRFVFPVKFRLK